MPFIIEIKSSYFNHEIDIIISMSKVLKSKLGSNMIRVSLFRYLINNNIILVMLCTFSLVIIFMKIQFRYRSKVSLQIYINLILNKQQKKIFERHVASINQLILLDNIMRALKLVGIETIQALGLDSLPQSFKYLFTE